MERNAPKPRSVSDGHSFSNGNGPQDDGPQMEGWLIHSAHWWLFA
jgi:hypothetical protein